MHRPSGQPMALKFMSFAVSRAFPSCTRSVLTEIYLCDVCSCHEIEDGNAPGQDTAHRGSIIRELQSYWAVEHPNIVGFYGACYSDEDHAICFGLELMSAGSLSDCL
eukprot:COSAG01_NODE_11193_length_1985_cov_2.538176_3_plen_107_part_00